MRARNASERPVPAGPTAAGSAAEAGDGVDHVGAGQRAVDEDHAGVAGGRAASNAVPTSVTASTSARPPMTSRSARRRRASASTITTAVKWTPLPTSPVCLAGVTDATTGCGYAALPHGPPGVPRLPAPRHRIERVHRLGGGGAAPPGPPRTPPVPGAAAARPSVGGRGGHVGGRAPAG